MNNYSNITQVSSGSGLGNIYGMGNAFYRLNLLHICSCSSDVHFRFLEELEFRALSE